jgi:hypothetical protein
LLDFGFRLIEPRFSGSELEKDFCSGLPGPEKSSARQSGP